MKYLIFIMAIFFTMCSKASEEQDESFLPEPPPGKKWVKIPEISDEFEVNQLDTNKWRPFHPYWSGRNSTFSVANVSVRDGNLRLKSTLKNVDDSVNAQNVTAACVTSKSLCNYGYYEARIKASDISMTSSFWFQGKYSEIDVVENIGKASSSESKWIDSTMMINTHFFKDGWENDIETPLRWKMPSGSSDEYHVYGVWWKDNKTAAFYHNGEKVGEISFGGPFDEPLYMFFDTEVFTWHGWPSKESLLDSTRNTMLVDWVRGWKLVDK